MSLPDTRTIEVGQDRTAEIRPAHPKDAQGWLDLLIDVSREGRLIALENFSMSRRDLARQFRSVPWSERSAALVAVADGKVVGQLSAYRDSGIYNHTCELGMSVDSRHRGTGVGTALMEGLFDWAGDFGIQKICLNVFPHNTRAISFYEKMGFINEGHRVRHAKLSYGYEDLLEMSKWVD